ncbi:MAG: transcription elongation factor GreA [Lachnospiraceae bacterium]|jgi:transcription elongation factor GreA|nr:transcription elongation factor GreA [Lachnospiraceae bacterium]
MQEKLTKSDIRKIQEEIEYRRLEVRPRLLEEVKETRAHGDLSENFEYHAAKREKNKNESRIRYLERMLRTAQVIDDSSREDEVGMNNTVEILFEEEGTVEEYRIVTSVRGDSLHNLISIESPLGRALLGHRAGDRVEVKVNDSYSYPVVIQKIVNTKDDSGDRIRSY